MFDNPTIFETEGLSIDKSEQEFEEKTIPDWIKNNAKWQSEGNIEDKTFVSGIEYLIKEEIIAVSETQQQSSGDKEIPDWIRNNAAWWADDQIDDNTFLQGIEFLVNKGIIQVSNQFSFPFF